MRPGQQKNRMRGRGRKGPNPLSRSYESNGPDVKIRGNAQHIAEKYAALARDANASGDRVMAENYLQHAEHYGRIVAAAQGTFQLQRDEADYEGEYEDGDEEAVQENGAPNGHPYPVPERAQGERPPQQPNQMRGDRERGDYNRDHQGNRDNRDYQNNRDFNRDGQGNREQRFNRDDRNRNRDNQGRDRNRDYNRENRPYNNDERRSWDGRNDRQNGRDREDRQQPGGLGPQPVIGDMPTGDYQPASAPRDDRGGRRFDRGDEQRFEEAAENVAATPAPESTVASPDAPQPVSGEPAEGTAPETEVAVQAGEGGRRRGRPRRPRLEDADFVGASAASSEEPQSLVDAAPATDGPAPQGEVEASDAAPAKRPRGRPRKKKPEDDGGDADTGHLPDFLLASNG